MTNPLPLLIAASALLLASCGSSGSTETPVADSVYYRQGADEARAIINHQLTTQQVRERLLEIRANEQQLRTDRGGRSADAYIQGFEQTLRQSGDTLANILN